MVGDAPAGSPPPGVTFAGFLHKEKPAELERLRSLLASARAVVHPTRSDIAPLLLVEAGYFGCPAISSRRFAIPELVADGESGLLLDDPTDAGAVAAAMVRMLEEEDGYRSMRRTTWARSRSERSKAIFEARLQASVREALAL